MSPRPGRLVLAIVLGIGLALLALACGRPADGRRRIAVIPKGTTHEFWKSIHAGAETAARALGVEAIWQGPLKEDDRTAQIEVVESFIARRVAGIVIAPLDEKALVAPLAAAAGQGIPVIVVDSDVRWPDKVSYIATDNYKGGVLAARKLGELCLGKGRVLMLRYVEGSESTTRREQGFLDALGEHHGGMELVSSNQRAGATVESAYAAAETLLVRFPQLDGIFCPNESAAFGMLRALQDSGRAGKVRFVGFDASPKLVEALAKGEIDGLVVQDPFKMGELGVRKMIEHLEGKPVDKRIDTGAVVVTRANMQEPAMRALLHPDLSILER